MQTKQITTQYIEYTSVADLNPEESMLMGHAKYAISKAYAPYSGFCVGVALQMEDGNILSGANQENASYPVGLCAERVALSAASSIYPGIAVKAMAVYAKSTLFVTNKPSGPCGICRQTILEYENRFRKPIALILAGENGAVYAFRSVKELLPLYFESSDIKI